MEVSRQRCVTSAKHWIGLNELMDWFDRHSDPEINSVSACYGLMGFAGEWEWREGADALE